MANAINVTVRKQWGPNGYQLLADAGETGVTKGVEVQSIRGYQAYSDPGDVDIYSILSIEQPTGTRIDMAVEETVATLTTNINA